MKAKEKISVSLDPYTSWIVEKALDRYNLHDLIGRAKPWLFKEAVRAVAFAIAESSLEGLSLPLTVELSVETEAQWGARKAKMAELQPELFPADTFEAGVNEKPPQKRKETIWDGFKRKVLP